MEELIFALFEYRVEAQNSVDRCDSLRRYRSPNRRNRGRKGG
jgi:hypothetical protein